MSQYEEVRIELERRRKELLSRMAQIKEDIRQAPNPDFAEQATERENDEVLDALDSASRQELAAIGRALARIEDGDYGHCAHCGDAIPAERLKVLPYSVYCVGCADKANAGHGAS